MTGPHGLEFTVEQMTARHTVARRADGALLIRRACVVRTTDGVRRVYEIPVDLLGDDQ